MRAESLPDSRAKARAYIVLGTVLAFHGDFAASQVQFTRSLELYRGLEDTPWTVYVSFRLGWLTRERDDPETARRMMVASLERSRELRDQARVAEVLVTLGEVAIMLEDPTWAKSLLEEGLAITRFQQEIEENIPWALNHLGHAAQLEKEYQVAERLHRESLAGFRELGEQHPGVA